MADQEEQNQQATAPEGEAPADDETSADDDEASADEEAPAGETPGEASGEASAEEGAQSVAESAVARLAEQAAVAEDVLEGLGEGERSTRKERVGIVVSDKMEKTIVVSIERSKKHAMYGKYLTRSARKMTHDENNEAGEGDTVRIMETRPISKHKRWRLVEIIERAA